MAEDQIVTTYYLDRNGEVASHAIGRDASGAVFFEAGDPPPSPDRVLDAEGLARIFRQRVLDAEAAHAEAQKSGAAARKAAVAEHARRRQVLIDAGMPEEAADIIVGAEPPPFVARPFSADSAASNFRHYGLTEEQIARIVGGWVG